MAGPLRLRGPLLTSAPPKFLRTFGARSAVILPGRHGAAGSREPPGCHELARRLFGDAELTDEVRRRCPVAHDAAQDVRPVARHVVEPAGRRRRVSPPEGLDDLGQMQLTSSARIDRARRTVTTIVIAHWRLRERDQPMSDALILEFSGVTADQYNAVNINLGIDPETGEGDWPAGLESHAGAINADGNLVVFEVWESQASQEEFMNSRLGPALGKAGVPEPTRAEWLTLLAHQTP